MKRMRIAQRSAAAVLVLLAFACARPADRPEQHSVSDDTYVAVMVDLLLLDAGAPRTPSAEQEEVADSARTEILATHGVSAAEIVEFAHLEGSDPGHMQDLWQRITQVYDSVRLERLRATSEAQSESEGKLGAEARFGEAADSVRPPGDAEPPPRSSPRIDRARMDSLLRARKGLPVQRDADPI